jgi:uncharacterized protein (DUF362 family)
MARRNDSHVVAITRVRDQDTFDALNRAVELIGGIHKIVSSGAVVLVKPNFVMGPTERGVTNPLVLEAVLRLIGDTSPARLMIGEGAADSYTWSAYRVWNIYDMATRYGAEVIDLNREPTVRIDVSERTGRDHLIVPRAAAEADTLVSVPTYKLWMGDLPMSLSLKNLFGLFPASHYGHNKTSRELARTAPDRTLTGEVGTELGIHHPTVEQSIAAINLACPSDLSVIDALEGGDGKGNAIRMDALFAGRNAVATDAVALAAAGFVPEEQRQIALCSQLGLGPGRLNEIRIVGEPLEAVRTDLRRLGGNVLEMPLAYCLDRLHTKELEIILDGLKYHQLWTGALPDGTSREETTAALLAVMGAEGYARSALQCLPTTGRAVLDLIIEKGGTSGNYYDMLRSYTAKTGESNSFWAGLRSLMRLGLAFLMHGHHKPYILLAQGVTASARTRGSSRMAARS